MIARDPETYRVEASFKLASLLTSYECPATHAAASAKNQLGTKMNKTELVDAVAARSYQTKAVTAAVVDAILETIKKSLSRNDPVLLIGFGGFEVVERSAKKVHHPGTGVPMTIPTKKVVKFKAGKILSNAVAGSRSCGR